MECKTICTWFNLLYLHLCIISWMQTLFCARPVAQLQVMHHAKLCMDLVNADEGCLWIWSMQMKVCWYWSSRRTGITSGGHFAWWPSADTLPTNLQSSGDAASSGSLGEKDGATQTRRLLPGEYGHLRRARTPPVPSHSASKNQAYVNNNNNNNTHRKIISPE